LDAAYAGDQSVSNNIVLVPSEPACAIINNGATTLQIVGDTSSGNLARCEGCNTDILEDSDVEQLEWNAKDAYGHFTIYSKIPLLEPEGGNHRLTLHVCAEGEGYQITPADGSALRGYCVRDTGDTFDCTTALVNTHGQRLFICYSDISG